MKKTHGLVFFITRDYIFSLANVLISLNRYSSSILDDSIVYVYIPEISEKEKQNLLSLNKNIVFIQSEEGKIKKKLKKHVYESDEVKKFINMFSLTIFNKFEALSLLKEHDDILLLDTDILIQGDIAPIFNNDLISVRLSHFMLSDRLKNKEEFKNANKFSLPNIGVVYIPKTCTKISTDLLYEYFNQYFDIYNNYAIDEDIFATVMFKERIGFNALDLIYNCNPNHQMAKKAVIVHSIGAKKFWNCSDMLKSFPEWIINHRIWLSISGDNGKYILNNHEENYYRDSIIKNDWNNLLNNIERKLYLIYDKYCTDRFYQIFLYKIPFSLHYEIKKISSDNFSVELHYEDKVLKTEVVSLFKKIADMAKNYKYEYIISNERFAIFKRVNKNDLRNGLNTLIFISSRQIYKLFGFSHYELDFLDTALIQRFDPNFCN